MTNAPGDPNTPPNDTPPPQQAAKPGLFKRLFGLAPSEEDLVIAIGPFPDAAEQDLARTVGAAFQDLAHVRLRYVKDTPVLGPNDVNRLENLPAAAQQAIAWLGKENADLVIWGDIPPPGTTMFIHFMAPPPVDMDPAGTISPFQPLNLPVGFLAEDFGGLLVATALAAINVQTDAKRQNRRNLIAEALERASQDISRIPRDFTLREKATVHAAYANALAAFAHLFPGGEVYHRAADAYGLALKGTLKGDSPTNWAYIQRNLGTMLQAIGERSDDVTTLDQALTAYRHALEVFTLNNTPFPWATTQNRIGEVLYRLDIKSGETAGLKEALTAFQGALKVLTKKSTPLLWSETLNNLGQVAQVLGREINNTEVVERAVSACQQALKVRTRDQHPTLWATTQNNMGSALFLLGRMSGDELYFQQALEAFMGAREVYESLDLTRMVEITDKNIQHAQARLPEGADLSSDSDASMWWMEGDDEAKD